MADPWNRTQGWQLDRRIPLSLVLALALQAAMALLWAGHAAERIQSLESHARDQAPVAERLARLEAQTTAMRAQLDRIESKLDLQVAE